ncbi:hypothetical protein A6V25_09670 [Nostoc sp. ATCC 53789]|nr:hypothetical protein A6V25_09670 [Nostoc sp. ATCC 53789]
MNYWVCNSGMKGNWGLGMGKRTWGQGELGTRGEKLKQVFPLVPNSPLPPLPLVLCSPSLPRWAVLKIFRISKIWQNLQ